MDEIEYLVEETYKHYQLHFEKESAGDTDGEMSVEGQEVSFFTDGPGIIYHIQKSTSIFVIRTLISKNVKEDYFRILEAPEDYPSLRLLDGGRENLERRLKFFMVENPSEAEVIHDQLHNRRFPVHEEMLCNISDPGFSWWLTKKENGFQLSFTMSVADEQSIKLGPLGDKEIALNNFQELGQLISTAGLGINIQNEMNRVQFTDCEEYILEELKDIFEFGVITETLKDLFKILAKRCQDTALVEGCWFYLNELAAMRRFWIQIQFDLNPEPEELISAE